MHINKIIIKDINISEYQAVYERIHRLISCQFCEYAVRIQSDWIKQEKFDIMSFMIVLDLLQHYTFIQEEINFIAQFCRAMVQILKT
jgi:hypothetical protein